MKPENALALGVLAASSSIIIGWTAAHLRLEKQVQCTHEFGVIAYPKARPESRQWECMDCGAIVKCRQILEGVNRSSRTV